LMAKPGETGKPPAVARSLPVHLQLGSEADGC
jgi:hypothetical protein